MFDSAYVSSRQAVSQANETVSNYVSSIKNKLDNLCDEMNNCTDTSSLQNAISTASRLEEDIYCVMLYDMQGNLLLDGNDNNDKVKSNPTNLSFDKAAFSDLLTDTQLLNPT